jgi:hypothetical protein
LRPCSTRPLIAKGRPSRRSLDQIAARERCAHRGAGNPLAAVVESRHLLEFELAACRILRKQLIVAGPPRTEPEVVADQQPSNGTAGDEHMLDEFGRRHEGKLPVEMLDVDAIDAGGLERSELVAQIGNAGRCTVRREELARMRFERHDR